MPPLLGDSCTIVSAFAPTNPIAMAVGSTTKQSTEKAIALIDRLRRRSACFSGPPLQLRARISDTDESMLEAWRLGRSFRDEIDAINCLSSLNNSS